ncbi:MAG: hypothetical protein ACYDH1_18700 [Anaerolineaceae bacterium]
MENNTLQIYYDSFVNQNEKKDFLLGMADYIELILNDKDCKAIISDIQKSKKLFLDKNSKLDEIATKKVRIIKEDYFEKVKEGESGDFSVGGNKYELKPSHKVSEIERKIKDGQGTTLWEAWDKMCLAYLAILKKEGVITKLEQQDEYDTWILQNNPEVVREMKQLETYCKDGQLRSLPSPPDVLMKEDYKPYATAVHNHLLKKLDEEKEFFSKAEAGFKKDAKTTGDEPNKEKDEDIVFEMAYSPRHRKILINGHQVKKFSWESENAKVFEDAYNNPKKMRHIKSKRRAQDFVNSFGFTKKAKSLFFPISADKILMLNNPVRKNDLKELGLEGITLKDILIDIRE